MSTYVIIDRLYGRKDYLALNVWIAESGSGLVEYANGGWYDHSNKPEPASLKFANETDAVAYVLANGGRIDNTLGQYETEYTSTRD